MGVPAEVLCTLDEKLKMLTVDFLPEDVRRDLESRSVS
jgi:hypothetical protein